MKELYIGLRQIIHESMTVFNKEAMTGGLSFSIYNALGYFVLPILIIVVTNYAGLAIGETLKGSIIGVLSIFVVLAFQVVFIATDKFANKISDKVKERTTSDGVKLYEDEKNYLIRMRNYTIQFVRQLVLLLLLSLFIILCSSLGLFFKNHIVQVSISSLLLSSFYIWLILLLKTIVSIYRLQMDDVEQNYNRIKN